MSNSSMVNGFQVQDDGTSIEVEITKDSLDSENVYCIVDEAGKNIYVWLGRLCGVRKRFIGARTANKMRNEFGTTFRVHSIDEGDESPNFLNALSNNID